MNEQITALLDKARRYIRSAELLSAEEDYDSAVSRLYYAMFYCAEALLHSKGLTYSSHRGVISGFGQHLVKTEELPAEMHRWLREAFDKRQVGDYVAIPSLSEEDVADLLEKTQEFTRRTETYLKKKDLL
jgi:uncharacterized protein (UPF0332 family)